VTRFNPAGPGHHDTGATTTRRHHPGGSGQHETNHIADHHTDEGTGHVSEQTKKVQDSDRTKEIVDGLAEILEDIAGVKPEDVELDKSFTDDLDVDSLSMVEIALAAEDKFDVKIPDDQLAGLKTVGDAVSYIEKAKAA